MMINIKQKLVELNYYEKHIFNECDLDEIKMI